RRRPALAATPRGAWRGSCNARLQREPGVEMLWVRITNPQYEQSRRYQGRIGEVVGRWGPDNAIEAREGYMVDFGDGEIVGVTEEEVEQVEEPEPQGRRESGC